jgi:hypothetical protein
VGDDSEDIDPSVVRRLQVGWDELSSVTGVVMMNEDGGFDAVEAAVQPVKEASANIDAFESPQAMWAAIPIEAPVEGLTDTLDYVPDPEEAWLRDAEDRMQLDDFKGVIEALEQAPSTERENSEWRALMADARSKHQKMLKSAIGDLTNSPKVLVASDEIIWLNLHHRAAFLLSLIDGRISYDDILSLSAMPRLDTLEVLVELLRERVIG